MARKQSTQAQHAQAASELVTLINDACVAALSTANHAKAVKDGKASLASMRERLNTYGVTLDVVKEAREKFGPTLLAVLGLPPVERSKAVATDNPLARQLVAGMAKAAAITKERYAGAVNAEARKAITQTPVKALQRLAPAQAKASTKPADVFEAAAKWGERLNKEFTAFRPKAINDKEFQRFAQVLFDSINGIGAEA